MLPPDLDLKAKMYQRRFSPQIPLGELTALYQAPYLDLRGPTSKGKGGCREGEGRGWVKGKREGKRGRERGEGRKIGGRGGKSGGGRKGAGRGYSPYQS